MQMELFLRFHFFNQPMPRIKRIRQIKRDAFQKDIKTASEFTNQERLSMIKGETCGRIAEGATDNFISFWDAYGFKVFYWNPFRSSITECQKTDKMPLDLPVYKYCLRFLHMIGWHRGSFSFGGAVLKLHKGSSRDHGRKHQVLHQYLHYSLIGMELFYYPNKILFFLYGDYKLVTSLKIATFS